MLLFIYFFNLDFAFLEEERQKCHETSSSRCCPNGIFLICADFKGRAKERVIASLSGCWDGARLCGIIHLFDLGKERSRNKLKMHFPKGSKDVIHKCSLPPISPIGKCIFRESSKGQNFFRIVFPFHLVTSLSACVCYMQLSWV